MTSYAAMTPIEQALFFESSGDIIEALKCYKACFSKDPNDEQATLGIASCALILGYLPTALEFYVRLLILNPQNPNGYLGRANILFQYAQDERALSDIQSAISYDFPPSKLRIDVAALLNDYGYPQRALDCIQPIKKQVFDDPDFQVEYACALIATKKLDHLDLLQILAIFQQNIQQDPIYALCVLAVDFHNGDTNAALKIENLLKKNPDLDSRAQLLL